MAEPSAPSYDETLCRRDIEFDATDIFKNTANPPLTTNMIQSNDEFGQFCRDTIRSTRRRKKRNKTAAPQPPSSASKNSPNPNSRPLSRPLSRPKRRAPSPPKDRTPTFTVESQTPVTDIDDKPPPYEEVANCRVDDSPESPVPSDEIEFYNREISTLKLSKWIRLPPNPPDPFSTVFLINTGGNYARAPSKLDAIIDAVRDGTMFNGKRSPHLMSFGEEINVSRSVTTTVTRADINDVENIEALANKAPKDPYLLPKNFVDDLENLTASGRSCLNSALLFAANYCTHLDRAFSRIILLNHTLHTHIGLGDEFQETVSLIARFYGIQIHTLQLSDESNPKLETLSTITGGYYMQIAPSSAKFVETLKATVAALTQSPFPNLKQTHVVLKVPECGIHEDFFPGNVSTRLDSVTLPLCKGFNNVIQFQGRKTRGDDFSQEFKVLL